MLKILAFALTGKLIIYLSQKFPFNSIPVIGRLFQEGKFLEKLFSCDLCLGFWLFSLLNFLFRVNLLDEIFYYPILSEIISGAIMSFIVHVFSVGWSAKFQEIVIE